MAIEALDETIRRFGTEIFVYHEIVHNKYVVDQFTRQGVKFVNTLQEVPPGSILLYSAHGVAPQIREVARERHLKTIDATCPLVTKVHIEAIRYAQENYKIILIGHEGHDEVLGTMGEAPENIILVETPEDVDALVFPAGTKLAYLTQTTLSVEEAGRVIRRLRERFPDIATPAKEDICYATTNRQEAVSALTPQCDVVIVLGSQNSSNSRRLAEIAASMNKPAYLIDGAHELQAEWFTTAQTVLVTAGASAPEVVVEECLDYLVKNYGATVETATIREEHVSFPIPRELRMLEQSTT